MGKDPEPENWDDILAEYVDGVRTVKGESIFKVWNKLIYTKYKISFLALCLDALKEKHSEKIALKVCELGYSLITDSEDRFQRILLIEEEAKNLYIVLNQTQAEYDMLCPEDEKNKVQRDELFYEKELAVLSKFMTYRIDKDKTFVLEYMAMQNNFLENHKPVGKKVNA